MEGKPMKSRAVRWSLPAEVLNQTPNGAPDIWTGWEMAKVGELPNTGDGIRMASRSEPPLR